MNANDRAVLLRAHQVMSKRNLPIGLTLCMPRTCAVRGLSYGAMYREKNGLWIFSECVMAAEEASGQSSGMTLRWDAISGAEREICPWCKTGVRELGDCFSSSIHCFKCSRDICVGRCSGQSFRCCDACGASGTISGTVESSVGFAMSGMGLQGTQQARIGKASAPKLMLTSGRR